MTRGRAPSLYYLATNLILLRSRGVTAAPAAKLPVAPDMVHRFKFVNRATMCPPELGKRLGPPSEAQCHHQGVTSTAVGA